MIWILKHLLLALSVIGTFLNVIVLIYIWRTFNVRKCLYFILALDSALSCAAMPMACGLFIAINAMNDLKSSFLCYGIQLYDLMNYVLCPLLTALISFIRCKSIISISNESQEQISDIFYIKMTCFLVFLIFVYINIWISVTIFGSFDLLAISNFCLYGENGSVPDLNPAFYGLNIPVILLMVSTFFMDLITWFFVRKNRIIMDRIPLNASIINFTFAIIYLIYVAIIFRFELSFERRFYLMLMSVTLANVLRNPLIATFAFKVNASNQKTSLEDRRQVEIEQALYRKWGK